MLACLRCPVALRRKPPAAERNTREQRQMRGWNCRRQNPIPGFLGQATLGRKNSPWRARYLRQIKTECTMFSSTLQGLRDHTLSTHSSQWEGLHTFGALHAASAVGISHPLVLTGLHRQHLLFTLPFLKRYPIK